MMDENVRKQYEQLMQLAMTGDEQAHVALHLLQFRAQFPSMITSAMIIEVWLEAGKDRFEVRREFEANLDSLQKKESEQRFHKLQQYICHAEQLKPLHNGTFEARLDPTKHQLTNRKRRPIVVRDSHGLPKVQWDEGE